MKHWYRFVRALTVTTVLLYALAGAAFVFGG